MIKSCDHQSSSLFFEEADKCVRGVSSSYVNSVFEVRPRRACGACGVYGTRESEGL